MKWKRIIIVLFITIILSLFFAKPLYFGLSDDEIDTIERDFFLSNTTKVFNEQLKFRDSAIQVYKENFQLFYNDSIIHTRNDSFLLSKIGIRNLTPKIKTSFVIPLSNKSLPFYFLVAFDSLFINYSIDEEKMNLIFQNQKNNPSEVESVLKYQDYQRLDKRVVFRLRTIGVIFYIGGAILLYFILAFLSSSKYDDFSNNLNGRISRFLTSLDDEIDVEDLDEKLTAEELRAIFKKRVEEVGVEIELIKNQNSSLFILEDVVRKAELKMKDVQGRSNLMLIAGLVMAFIGVVVFYFTLPSDISNSTDVLKIVTLSIRPTLILIFIETIAWYLLKQHRVLLFDFKYYHAIYNKKSGYLATFKLINESKYKDSEMYLIIPAMILTEDNKQSLGEQNSDEPKLVMPNDLLSNLLDKIINKI